MANLTNPRPKKRVYQSEEAPFPVPIETITKKQATDGHWFFYTGHLATNCVLIKREGDIIFLYKMGFFGKGILSKSKPQHQKFESSFQGLRRKNLPAKERQFQQQRFQQVRHHKYERHLSWHRLLAQQVQQKQREDESTEESQIQKEPFVSSRETSIGIQESSTTLDMMYGSNSVELEIKSRTDVENNSQYDIPSTSGLSKGSLPDARTEYESVKRDGPAEADGDNAEEKTTRHLKQPEWMRDGIEISESNTSACEVPSLLDTNDDVNYSGKIGNGDDGTTSKTCKENTPQSEESGEEFIIVSDDEGEVDNKDVKPDVQKKTIKKVVKKSDPFKIYEYLQLSFEEAFFLSFGLGCLSVLDEDGKPMMLSRMWRTFCSRQSNFLPNYVVYHYLRSKGWVPKGGAKYGADFVLYKKGPPFYHASYSVIVNMIDEHSSQDVDKRFWNWNALTGMNRITENVAKEVLVCYVLKPPGIQEVDLASPKCLRRFKVQEVVMKRWVSSRERESSNAEPLIS